MRSQPSNRGSKRRPPALVNGLLLGVMFAGSGLSACQEEQNAAVARVHKARTLMEQGDLRAAVAAAEQALRDDAKNPEALGILGLGRELAHDYNGAADAYTKLVEQMPQDSIVRCHLGRALALAGRLDEARAALLEARTLDPRNLDALMLSAAVAKDREAAQQIKQAMDAIAGDVSKGLSAEQVLVRAELARTLGEPSTDDADKRAEKLPVSDPRTATALAELYRRQGRLAAVESLLLRLTATAPNPEPIAVQLVNVALQQDHLEIARSALTKISADLQAAPEAVLAHARVAAAEEKWEEAEKRFKLAIAKLTGPQLERARFQLAQVLLALGRQDEVEAELRALLDAPFGYVGAAMMLCDLLESTARGAEVVGVLAPLAERHPDDGVVLARLGQAQLEQGQADAAEATFKKLAALDPKDPRGPQLVGTALEAMGKTEEAEAKFRQALALAPGMPAAVKSLVGLAVADKRPKDAVALVQEQLTAQPGSGFLHRTLGQLQADLGKHDEAEAAFRHATELEPQQAVNWFQWGEYLHAKGETVRAQELFRKGLSAEPTHVSGWMRLGDLLFRAGDRAGALDAFETVLKLEPLLVPAQNNVAMLLADAKRDLPRALSLAKAAHEAAPDVPSVTDTLGWLYHLTGDNAHAVKLLEQAASGLQSAGTYFHLGAARAANGDAAGAREALQKALKLDPRFDGADEAKATLASLH